MRRIHPAGLYEAIVDPQGSTLQSADFDFRSAELHAPRDELHRRDDDHARSVRLPAPADRLRPAPARTKARTGRATTGSARSCGRSTASKGVNFAVWAPNATSVSVVGDFNDWDGRRHPMRKHIPSGFWELFVPGLGAGTLYKYSDPPSRPGVREVPIPYGFAAEVPPRTASKVVRPGPLPLARRRLDGPPAASTNWLEQPLSFYEVHLGSWQRARRRPRRAG